MHSVAKNQFDKTNKSVCSRTVALEQCNFLSAQNWEQRVGTAQHDLGLPARKSASSLLLINQGCYMSTTNPDNTAHALWVIQVHASSPRDALNKSLPCRLWLGCVHEGQRFAFLTDARLHSVA